MGGGMGGDGGLVREVGQMGEDGMSKVDPEGKVDKAKVDPGGKVDNVKVDAEGKVDRVDLGEGWEAAWMKGGPNKEEEARGIQWLQRLP